MTECQRIDDWMFICWHFQKFDHVAFRKVAPANLVGAWCNWLAQRPQDQRHRDLMAAGIASALCASNGMELSPEHFMFGERKPPEELSQVQIDAGVSKLKLLQGTAKPPDPNGMQSWPASAT